jgi:nodulation protein E
MLRVAVTGMGVVSAIGCNVSEFADSLRSGRSGIGPIRRVDTSALRFHNGAEIRCRLEAALGLDRFAELALIAAREAVADAGNEWTPELREDAAVITGTSIGGQDTQVAAFDALYKQGLNRLHPLSIPKTMPNAAASHISIELGIHGPAFTVAAACSSAAHAIGHAFRMVRSGEAPVAIAGGSDAPFSFGMLKGWEAMRVISPDTCRPFSKDRDGTVLGEGAAILILEPLEAARARGARVHGEIAGFGMSSDASHITQPSAEGAARAIERVLRDAGYVPEQVGYINAHGTGTIANDVTETFAIRRVFDSHTNQLAVSSTKSMHGHALGASPALEAVATILALRDGVLPPTANFTELDPNCDLDVIPNNARSTRVAYAISNSFAFGGLNAVLAFRAP